MFGFFYLEILIFLFLEIITDVPPDELSIVDLVADQLQSGDMLLHCMQLFVRFPMFKQ